MEEFSIITPVLNEKDSLLRIVNQLQGELDELKEFIVVIDEDKVNIDWEKAQVIQNSERVGKAHAINQGLKANSSPIVVLLSSDIELEADTVRRLVETVSDGADIAAPRVRTRNTGSAAGRIHRAIWELHHHVSSMSLKAGEAIAFRPSEGIPDEIVTDEEYISADRPDKEYVPSAEVFNSPPASLKQLYIQRRRIFSGHLHLRRGKDYSPPTNQPLLLLKAVSRYLEDGGDPDTLLKAAILESFARAEGLLWTLCGIRPWKWQTIKTV